MRGILGARVSFCLVAASDMTLDLAGEVAAMVGIPGRVTARSVAFRSVAFRNDEPPDALVVMLDGEAFERGVDLIARMRLQGPACRALAVGEGLSADEISALRAAGVTDVFVESLSPGRIAERTRTIIGCAQDARPIDVRALLKPHIKGLIGTSPAFVKQLSKLPTIAGCDAGVLILGETGTGKEVCAQAVHYLSARASKPWVAVNCGAIPIDLVEDELFGHVKGAYTTAHSDRHGLVREAEGGTLFLDDIDALAPHAQVKLLRFLQEKEYRPVGSNSVRHADVRVIAASNHELADMAMRGTFRQDLFFRLNVLTLNLPPLRERCEDLPILTQHFVQQSTRQWNRRVEGITPGALFRLLSYSWPGNVRELKHVIERAVLFAEGPLLSDEDLELGGGATAVRADESFRHAKARTIEQFERAYIERLLITHQGNITHAAHAASKNRRAFWQLIRKHGIEPQRFRSVVQ